MRFLFTFIALVTLCVAAVCAETPGKSKSRVRSVETKQSTLTGCVDQRGEHYVLKRTDSMQTETLLSGKAFSDDNFARFVGQKASVTGELKSQDGQEVLQVTKIDKVADTCH